MTPRPQRLMPALDAPPTRWPTAIAILVLLALFCAGLVLVNMKAENVPGRRVSDVLVSDLPGQAFTPAALPHWHCCATSPMRFRLILDAETASKHFPALLVVSAHDNARIFVDGVLVAGEGQSAGQVANWSRRPRLMHIPSRWRAQVRWLKLRCSAASVLVICGRSIWVSTTNSIPPMSRSDSCAPTFKWQME
ncbi:MAG: hypothetical protein M0D54_19460 [Hyphomonadaceae bacterium JAD_PAG50586_4]|nr:MAG: hypothetical protein M0D54_19460 [Hyphomonadaceae bacterium JAD_PAG50586_4]